MAKVAKSAAAYLALGLFLSAVCGASADETCTEPLQLIASLPMTPIDQAGLVTIPISLNGVEKQFLYDTGAYYPMIGANTADQLKLHRIPARMELYSATGKVSRDYALVNDFALGRLRGSRMEFMIFDEMPFDGIFTPTALPAFDFEMDFAARKLLVVSSDHCEGKVVHWPAKIVSVVPVDTANNHLTVPVLVDGRKMEGILDTGADESIIRLDVAQRLFGIDPASPDLKQTGVVNGDDTVPMYSYPFKTLSLDGVTVTNPQIRIVKDVANRKADQRNKVGSNISRLSDDIALPQVVVGMTVLKKLHIYLASKEKKLYVTEAAAAEPASPNP